MNFLGTALNYGLGGSRERGRWSAVVACRALFREGDANRVLRGSLLLAVGASVRYFIANGDIYMKSFHNAFEKLEKEVELKSKDFDRIFSMLEMCYTKNSILRLKRVYLQTVLDLKNSRLVDADVDVSIEKIKKDISNMNEDNMNIQIEIEQLQNDINSKERKII